MRLLLLLVTVTACSTPPRAEPVKEPAAPIRSGGMIEAAGVYWVPYVTCSDCEPPVALVAHVTRSPVAARAIAAKLEGTLPLGFPYVIHTDEINAGSERGIAVVIGNYSSLAAAREAQKLARGSRVLELGADPYPTVESPRHVTVIDRGRPVTAWSKADVDGVFEKLEGNVKESDFSMLPPACTVKPGDVFLAEESELHWYQLAPVRCGKSLAYVPWTSTLHGHAVIVPDGEGHRLYQVVGAQCDSPIIESWPYGPHGRGREIDNLLASAGC